MGLADLILAGASFMGGFFTCLFLIVIALIYIGSKAGPPGLTKERSEKIDDLVDHILRGAKSDRGH